MSRIITLLFLILGATSSTFGQDFQQTNTTTTSQTNNEESYDSTTIVDNTFFDIFYGNPGKAAFYGLIIPSGGQIYNKKWWKLPIVLGIEGYTFYNIINTTTLYNGYQEAYLNNLNNLCDSAECSYLGISDVNILRTRRDATRKAREYSYVFFIGTHIVALFEAFIDRHLMEFDISDDLTFKPIPSQLGPVSGISLTIPLNKKKEYNFSTVIE